MGLTYDSTKNKAFNDFFNIEVNENQHLITLAGNPNTGKSTVFNYLTGLNQHTGNWPGKTVVNARGKFKHNQNEYILVDVPGTYSLMATSEEELVARDFICFAKNDVVLVVTDATCLERNLNLLFQIMELTDQVILIINLIDEAKKKKIMINKIGLEYELGIPVVLTSAKTGYGMNELKDTIEKVIDNSFKYQTKEITYSSNIEEKIKDISPLIQTININKRWLALRILDGDDRFIESMKRYLNEEDYSTIKNIKNQLIYDNMLIREEITEQNFRYAEAITKKYVREERDKLSRDKKIDDFVTSRKFGIPLMLILLFFIFYITIRGANYPSTLIANLLFKLETFLSSIFIKYHAPEWLRGLLVSGIYRTLAWVISVMLPPMAIFFPIFTLLEDL